MHGRQCGRTEALEHQEAFANRGLREDKKRWRRRKNGVICPEKTQSASSKEVDGLGTLNLKQQGDLLTCAISGEGIGSVVECKKAFFRYADGIRFTREMGELVYPAKAAIAGHSKKCQHRGTSWGQRDPSYNLAADQQTLTTSLSIRSIITMQRLLQRFLKYPPVLRTWLHVARGPLCPQFCKRS